MDVSVRRNAVVVSCRSTVISTQAEAQPHAIAQAVDVCARAPVVRAWLSVVCAWIPACAGLTVGFVLAFNSVVAAAHPFHGSIAEADWNAKNQCYEVSLQVHASDLEIALRKYFKRSIDLEKTTGVDKLIETYLRNCIRVTNSQGNLGRVKVVGREVKVKHAWVYFELSPGIADPNIQVSHELFFSILPDQENTIVFSKGKPQKSLVFNREYPRRRLTWTDSD